MREDLVDIISRYSDEFGVTVEFTDTAAKFVTDDGESLYSEIEIVYSVTWSYNVESKILSEVLNDRKHYPHVFNHVVNADAWIKANKPRFSEKQVLDAIRKAYRALNTNSTTGRNQYFMDEAILLKELGL